MELQHRFTVPAPIDETWTAFNDLERIAPCFPGATLTSVEGDQFSGSVKVKLGPISMQYSGTGTFLERDETSHTAKFEAKGKDKRGNGTAAATVTAVLTPDGDVTAVEVSTDLAITGKPAQFGRGVIQDVSNKLLDRFTTCLADTLFGPAEEAADEPPAKEPAPVPAPAPARCPAPPPRAATLTVDDGVDLFRTVAPVLAASLCPPGRRHPARAAGAGPGHPHHPPLTTPPAHPSLMRRIGGSSDRCAQRRCAQGSDECPVRAHKGRMSGGVRGRRAGRPRCRTPRRPSAGPRRGRARCAARARR